MSQLTSLLSNETLASSLYAELDSFNLLFFKGSFTQKTHLLRPLFKNQIIELSYDQVYELRAQMKVFQEVLLEQEMAYKTYLTTGVFEPEIPKNLPFLRRRLPQSVTRQSVSPSVQRSATLSPLPPIHQYLKDQLIVEKSDTPCEKKSPLEQSPVTEKVIEHPCQPQLADLSTTQAAEQDNLHSRRVPLSLPQLSVEIPVVSDQRKSKRYPKLTVSIPEPSSPNIWKNILDDFSKRYKNFDQLMLESQAIHNAASSELPSTDALVLRSTTSTGRQISFNAREWEVTGRRKEGGITAASSHFNYKRKRSFSMNSNEFDRNDAQKVPSKMSAWKNGRKVFTGNPSDSAISKKRSVKSSKYIRRPRMTFDCLSEAQNLEDSIEDIQWIQRPRI